MQHLRILPKVFNDSVTVLIETKFLLIKHYFVLISKYSRNFFRGIPSVLGKKNHMMAAPTELVKMSTR